MENKIYRQQQPATTEMNTNQSENLRHCQIHVWYTKFKPYTIPTLFHTLPLSFVHYLLGLNPDESTLAPFFLPRSVSGSDPFPVTDPVSVSNSDFSDSDSDSPTPPSFPELESQVVSSIETLGGAVVPKLNWSSPKDATWISFDGTLCCRTFTDVALLLRSSDAVMHDLSMQGFEFVLALRKYYNGLRPELEFRCFVKGHELVAVSQRDVTAFYPSLIERRRELVGSIARFFEDVVGGEFELENYVFDVYVRSDGKVKLVDFNPWRESTLPLLFSWEELESDDFASGEDDMPVFRIVGSQCGVRPGLKTAVPYDYLDTSEGSGWDEFLKMASDELSKQSFTD